ncbi:hypothetical protein ERJ75_000635900 [Trypanosoma vivax]|nr:hypothetical protein ERJ75_000635900 [Trypanosoma vivax]
MLAAALSQHRDAWRTTHTETASRKTPERQVRGRENAEGVQCAPRHASPARSAVRRVALRAAAILRPGAGCHARADSADRHPAVPARIADRSPADLVRGKGRRHGNGVVCVRQLGAGTASSDMAPR